MAITIGGVTVDYLYGVPPTLSMSLEKYHRPGLDGIGFRKIGKAQGEWVTQVQKFVADESAWSTLEASLAALVGTVVAIVDGFGTTHNNCLVETCQLTYKQAAISAGSTGILVRYALTCARTA